MTHTSKQATQRQCDCLTYLYHCSFWSSYPYLACQRQYGNKVNSTLNLAQLLRSFVRRYAKIAVVGDQFHQILFFSKEILCWLYGLRVLRKRSVVQLTPRRTNTSAVIVRSRAFVKRSKCGASGRYPTARHLHCAHCYYAKLSCFNKQHRLQLEGKKRKTTDPRPIFALFSFRVALQWRSEPTGARGKTKRERSFEHPRASSQTETQEENQCQSLSLDLGHFGCVLLLYRQDCEGRPKTKPCRGRREEV